MSKCCVVEPFITDFIMIQFVGEPVTKCGLRAWRQCQHEASIVIAKPFILGDLVFNLCEKHNK